MLESPDDESRSPEEQGRRIVRTDEHRAWGWLVVNYLKYRCIRDEGDRREQNKIAQANWRAKRVEENADSKQSKPASASVSQRKHESAHREVEVEVDLEADRDSEAILGEPPEPPAPAARSGKVAQKRAPKPVTSTEVWNSYRQAYAEKYGTDPVRNAKVNAQLSQLVSRLGADEAPGVARAYLANRNSLYVAAKHCTDLLLRDAEKLRTEWATGDVTHQRDARESDRLASTGAMWEKIGQKLKAEGIE